MSIAEFILVVYIIVEFTSSDDVTNFSVFHWLCYGNATQTWL